MSKRRQDLEEKLSTLREKEAQILLQLRDAEAREKSKERKRDTRRKIILGALCKKSLTEEPESDFSKTLLILIADTLTNTKDRSLFGLPPLPSQPTSREKDGSSDKE